MTKSIPAIETKNLILRPLRPEDAIRLHGISQDEEVMRYFPGAGLPSVERMERFIHRQLEHWEKYGWGHWGIEVKGEAEIAGWAGLQYLVELEETEVAYMLARPLWGKGLGTQAAGAAIEFGFRQCGLDHIIGLVHPDNKASIRVLEKCGLAYQETITLWGMELTRHRINFDEGVSF
jgi:[ribosomal protein S5]-alanine N-acetyltransferase